MANRIGDSFGTIKDRLQSLEEIEGHLRRFREPRMRAAPLAHSDREAGAGVSDILLDGLRTRRDRIV